jgi:2-haloacid dehalogenase
MTPTFQYRAAVFDIGNVLVGWQPSLAFLPELGSQTNVDAFLERTDFFAHNLRADAGARWEDLAGEIDDPTDRALLANYPARFGQTVPIAIEQSWELMAGLRARGMSIHAITNWSAQTWPAGVAAHPRLGTAFGVTVISGFEGIIKPDPRIFQLLCTRAQLAPNECLFIDDSYANISGASAFGMDTIHFTGPEALRSGLIQRGLL